MKALGIVIALLAVAACNGGRLCAPPTPALYQQAIEDNCLASQTPDLDCAVYAAVRARDKADGRNAIDWQEVDRAIDEAVRETDRKIALRHDRAWHEEIERTRRELEAIVAANRACFELAMDGRLSTEERASLVPVCQRIGTLDK